MTVADEIDAPVAHNGSTPDASATAPVTPGWWWPGHGWWPLRWDV
jgi:hypothetical protein